MGSIGVINYWKRSHITGRFWECLRSGYIPADTLIFWGFKIHPKTINIRAISYRKLLRLGISEELNVGILTCT